jgi:hypothetical protein
VTDPGWRAISGDGPAAPRTGRVAARAAAAFCFAFAGFQVALAAGAPFGAATWGGATAVLSPGLRVASAAAAVYLTLAGAAMLVRAGDWGRALPRTPFRWFNAFLALQLTLNLAGDLASSSVVERYVMGAACAVGAILCVVAFLRAPN